METIHCGALFPPTRWSGLGNCIPPADIGSRGYSVGRYATRMFSWWTPKNFAPERPTKRVIIGGTKRNRR